MRTPLSRTTLAALAGLALLLPLAACGSGDDEVADDPALVGAADEPVSDDDPAPDDEPAADDVAGLPAAIPAADGPVRSLHLATVLDEGDDPRLCLGPIAESWPPQCEGIPLEGWDWADAQGVFERQKDVRWGSFAVTGTFDGETFSVTELVPAALFDPMVPEPSQAPTPAATLEPAELQRVAEEVMQLPGALSATSDDVRVTVDVVHDDGTLQAWADETYGVDVVNVVSMLVPAV